MLIMLFHVIHCHQEAAHLPPFCPCGLAPSPAAAPGFFFLNPVSSLTWGGIFPSLITSVFIGFSFTFTFSCTLAYK